MKFTFLTILLFYLLNLNAQLYNRPKKIEFDFYHIEKKDTLKRDVVSLYCSGERWISPRNIPIENSWSVVWSYHDKGGVTSERTGVEETSKKIFLHPIRVSDFSILEFCPFPIIKFPLKIGNKWEWTLDNIPASYFKLIKRHRQKTTDKVVNNYLVENKIHWYNNATKQTIDCFVIKAIGKSTLGETKLTMYFSEKFGFVMMNFQTLNNDTYVFVLKEYLKNTDNNINLKRQRWY